MLNVVKIHYSNDKQNNCFNRNGCLTWHDGAIPADEIWLKVGGDKGGNSFKLAVQVVNTTHPNSQNNTIVICCFEASDSVANLKHVQSLMDQVSHLEQLTWR